jgi:peptidoglycan/xylan/chitin deacetylase (PgdA/CDA1 family)
VYHACFRDVPPEFRGHLHNVRPDVFHSQVMELKKHWDIVSVDELFSCGEIEGKACVTFDDGYRCIYDEAVPMLIEEEIPATVFLSGAMSEGKGLWRDRVRYLIHLGLVSAFLDFASDSNPDVRRINEARFYRETKSTHVNSVLLTRQIDLFLDENGHRDAISAFNTLGSDKEILIDHPLIRYGNHGYNHYVLSSLSAEEQEEELISGKGLVDRMAPSGRVSSVFAVPFGGTDTVNRETFELLSKLNYEGILFARSRFNTGVLASEMELPIADRWMAPSDMKTFQRIFLGHPVIRVCKKLLSYG